MKTIRCCVFLQLALIFMLLSHAFATGERSRRGTNKRRRSTARKAADSTTTATPMAPATSTTSGRRRMKKAAAHVPRITQEIMEFSTDQTLINDGLYAELIDDDMNHWLASFMGPPDTPYAGGRFWVEINVPEKYPNIPPEVLFKTKIYHPNIRGSDICVDILKGPPAWTPGHGIAGILRSLQLLLQEANPDDPLNTQASDEYVRNPRAFRETAQRMTKQYANPDFMPSLS